MKYENEIHRQRLPLAKPPIDENPRNHTAELGTGIYSTGGKGGGILERYREMLRERDEELLREEDEVPPLSTDEAVRIYEALSNDLTINSKPVITDLTIIAGELRECGEGIADVICCRVLEAPVDLKLPSLYLLDSVVKNIGCEYIDYFSARLPEVFLEAYRKVDPSMYPALRHLFRNWSKVFPDSVLQKIDDQLQLISESPRLSHGIHVNPKYVEARRQSEHDNDTHRSRVATSPLKSYVQVAVPSDAYDVLKAEEQSVTATGRGGRVSPDMRANRWFMERDTPRTEPDHRQGRSIERDMVTTEWWRKRSSDRTFQNLDSSPAYNQMINPRALIDAYGSDRGEYNKSNWQDRPKALIDAYGRDRGTGRQPHWRDNRIYDGHLNGSISSKLSTRSWKNTDEVEYNWEDMSPTLADGKRHSYFQSSLHSQGGSLRTRYDPGALAVSSDSGIRASNWSTSVPDSELNRRTTRSMPDHLDQRFHSGFQSSQSLYNSNGRGNILVSHLANNAMTSIGENIPPIGSLSELDVKLHKPPMVDIFGRSTNFDIANGDGTAQSSVGAWPPETIQKPQQPSSYSVLPRQKQFGQPNSVNASDNMVIQGSKDSQIFSEQRFDATLNNVMQFPNQHTGYFPNKQPNQMSAATLTPQYMTSQEGHRNLGPTATAPRLDNIYTSQGNTSLASNHVSNMMPGVCFPFTVPPRQPYIGTPLSASIPRPGGGVFSGLINSLMSQGLISLANQQGSVGVDFNPDTLKVRHDSAIQALYSDLPRQCTTCGLRFNDQELHRNHMDWHVTKNRMNKNRKQKASRKWFASASMWLSGADASGPEAVPGFLPNDTVVENQDEEEMAVPADEEQTTCGLCGEPFDDFYSHETDEWMYRGTVYLNMNAGLTAGLDRSQLGPIVHAKCRPDPVTSSQNVATNNQPFDVDDSQRKRLRVS